MLGQSLIKAVKSVTEQVTLRKGIYYLKDVDKYVALKNVKEYEDLQSHFYILTWEDETGVYPKTMVTQDQAQDFLKVGDL